MSKLPPSERCKNYAEALMRVWPVILVLVGGIGYSNKDTLREWAGLTEADGQTEIDGTADRWAQITKFSQEVRAELQEIKSNSDAIRSQLSKRDRQNYQELIEKIDSMQEQLTTISDLVD